MACGLCQPCLTPPYLPHTHPPSHPSSQPTIHSPFSHPLTYPLTLPTHPPILPPTHLRPPHPIPTPSFPLPQGCTAPSYDKNQLHAAVVELYTGEEAEIKYSTVQNWYAGNEEGVGGIYNFVTKRGLCDGRNSKISWTQVETGSAITWKYPSVVLRGEGSRGEFYSVALTNNRQQADTGTKVYQGFVNGDQVSGQDSR